MQFGVFGGGHPSKVMSFLGDGKISPEVYHKVRHANEHFMELFGSCRDEGGDMGVWGGLCPPHTPVSSLFRRFPENDFVKELQSDQL